MFTFQGVLTRQVIFSLTKPVYAAIITDIQRYFSIRIGLRQD